MDTRAYFHSNIQVFLQLHISDTIDVQNMGYKTKKKLIFDHIIYMRVVPAVHHTRWWLISQAVENIRACCLYTTLILSFFLLLEVWTIQHERFDIITFFGNTDFCQTPFSGACRCVRFYSIIVSRQKYARSNFKHFYFHLCSWRRSSTAFYQCPSPSHLSAQLISHRTPIWLSQMNSRNTCLYPLYPQPQTHMLASFRIFFYV